jgi:hypothetical protein
MQQRSSGRAPTLCGLSGADAWARWQPCAAASSVVAAAEVAYLCAAAARERWAQVRRRACGGAVRCSACRNGALALSALTGAVSAPARPPPCSVLTLKTQLAGASASAALTGVPAAAPRGTVSGFARERAHAVAAFSATGADAGAFRLYCWKPRRCAAACWRAVQSTTGTPVRFSVRLRCRCFGRLSAASGKPQLGWSCLPGWRYLGFVRGGGNALRCGGGLSASAPWAGREQRKTVAGAAGRVRCLHARLPGDARALDNPYALVNSVCHAHPRARK